LSAKAEKLVSRLGVEVVKGVMVTNIDGEGVTFKRGETIEKLPARTVLWAGGVTTNEFGRKLGERTNAETDRSGRIKLNSNLTIPNFPDIFVVGDLGLSLNKDDKPLQVSRKWRFREGLYAAKAIRTRLKGQQDARPFHYFDKGDMAVIGRAAAIANISASMFLACQHGLSGFSFT